MNKTILVIIAALVFVAFNSCKKKEPDNTTAWVGTYNGSSTGFDSINQVVISKVNNTTLKIQYQASNGSAYNFGALQAVSVNSATAINFNENDSLFPYGGDYYNIVGQGNLSGNTLTLTDTARNTVSANPAIIFSFTGSK